jgi:hypothetical protein
VNQDNKGTGNIKERKEGRKDRGLREEMKVPNEALTMALPESQGIHLPSKSRQRQFEQQGIEENIQRRRVRLKKDRESGNSTVGASLPHKGEEKWVPQERRRTSREDENI